MVIVIRVVRVIRVVHNHNHNKRRNRKNPSTKKNKYKVIQKCKFNKGEVVVDAVVEVIHYYHPYSLVEYRVIVWMEVEEVEVEKVIHNLHPCFFVEDPHYRR